MLKPKLMEILSIVVISILGKIANDTTKPGANKITTEKSAVVIKSINWVPLVC